jgi:hypothetical protein
MKTKVPEGWQQNVWQQNWKIILLPTILLPIL